MEYNEGDRVQFTVNGDVARLLTGTIRGVSFREIVTHWIVQLDSPIKDWQYSSVSVQDSFIRKVGENRPFGCENIAS